MNASKISYQTAFAGIDPYNADMPGRVPTKPAPAFGAQFAALRKARGLTQAQLAATLGMSVEMLTYYERRATNPSADFIAKAAAFFNVSADDLLAINGKAPRKPGPPSQLEQLAARAAKLPRSEQKAAIKMLEGLLAAAA